MNVEDIFEIAFENAVEKHGGSSCEYIPDFLENSGYIVTFYYSRNESDKPCVKFLLQNFNRDDEFFESYYSTRKSKDEKKQDVIEHLKKEWNIPFPTSYEYMNELDGMVELSKYISNSYLINTDIDEIEYLFVAVILPLIDFIKINLVKLKDGKEFFSEYEKIVGIFLNIYFMSEGFKVVRQVSDATSQHRRDFHVRIKDTNSRLFNKLIDDTECKSIVVECKNSKKTEQLVNAVNQINRYSNSARFGKLGLVFVRSKGNPFKQVDYVNSPCINLIFDDKDILNVLSDIESSFSRFKRHKDKETLGKEVSACFDIYDRYQELCEKSH
ncbi:hypothetical protein AB4374_13205 [Vibrio splendidus]